MAPQVPQRIDTNAFDDCGQIERVGEVVRLGDTEDLGSSEPCCRMTHIDSLSSFIRKLDTLRYVRIDMDDPH